MTAGHRTGSRSQHYGAELRARKRRRAYNLNLLEDALVRRVVRNPRGVRTGRRLIQQRERVRVRVEPVGRDEGRVASGEDGEVDHGWALIRRALTGGAAAGMEPAGVDYGFLYRAAGCRHIVEEGRSRVPAGRSSAIHTVSPHPLAGWRSW